MKVTTSINGTEITIENDEHKEIIEFLNDLTGTKEKVERAENDMKLAQHCVELTRPLHAVWSFLVDHEKDPNGATVSGVERALGLSNGTANSRLCRLTNMGYAERVGRGRYKAITP